MVRKLPREGKTMGSKPSTKQDDPEQSKRFLEAAREAGADETEEGAARAFKAVARSKPSKSRK
jgi:hypothetical protein